MKTKEQLIELLKSNIEEFNEYKKLNYKQNLLFLY